MANCSIGGASSYPHALSRVSEEVFRYNRLLDRISVITTNGLHPSGDEVLQSGQNATAEDGQHPGISGDNMLGTSREGLLQHQHLAEPHDFQSFEEEFSSLLQQIREKERTVSRDHATRRFFAFQDELLPSIGEWSTDRRRRLRNQVFLAGLEIENRDQRRKMEEQAKAVMSRPPSLSSLLAVPSPSDLAVQPAVLALCAGLFIYAVAMIALIFGRGWPCQGWIMLITSALAMACLALAGYLHVKNMPSCIGAANKYRELMAEAALVADTSTRSGSDTRESQGALSTVSEIRQG